MPKFRELNFTSAYEVYPESWELLLPTLKWMIQYLEKRFDRSVRMCASFAFSFFMVKSLSICFLTTMLIDAISS